MHFRAAYIPALILGATSALALPAGIPEPVKIVAAALPVGGSGTHGMGAPTDKVPAHRRDFPTDTVTKKLPVQPPVKPGDVYAKAPVHPVRDLPTSKVTDHAPVKPPVGRDFPTKAVTDKAPVQPPVKPEDVYAKAPVHPVRDLPPHEVTDHAPVKAPVKPPVGRDFPTDAVTDKLPVQPPVKPETVANTAKSHAPRDFPTKAVTDKAPVQPPVKPEDVYAKAPVHPIRDLPTDMITEKLPVQPPKPAAPAPPMAPRGVPAPAEKGKSAAMKTIPDFVYNAKAPAHN